MRTPMGLALAPTRDGKVLAPELFSQLPAGERESIQREIEAIQTELETIMSQVPQWEREHRDAVQALNRETAGFAIAHLMRNCAAPTPISPGSWRISTRSSATSRRMSTIS